MKINLTATVIAIVYNIINFLFWQHILIMPNATSMVYAFIFPCFWILTIVVVGIISWQNKSKWFNQSYRTSTIIALLFCTPAFFLLFRVVNSPSAYREATGNDFENGYTIKFEKWVYYTGGLEVVKYWKSDKKDCEDCDSSHFKRDSTWVYFDKNKDTIKVEVYKNGKLIRKKNNPELSTFRRE